MWVASALRQAGSAPRRPPPTRTAPPPVAPEASATAPSSRPTCRPSRPMLPPMPLPPSALRPPLASSVPAPASTSTWPPLLAPSALVRLPAASVAPWLALISTCPPAPVPRLSARTMPCWLTSAACRSMRPPLADRLPRFSTSPCGALSCRPSRGVAVSTRSTWPPAASTTWPSGASIRPSLRTPPAPPISSTRPPLVLRNAPWLTTAALNAPSAAPPKLKRPVARPARQASSSRCRVLATRPATSTRAPAPNSTPWGLSSHTCPLLDRLPRMCDGFWPTTRFSTLLLADGCTKRTASCAPMENCCQFSNAPALLVTVSWRPWVCTVAWPCTTCRPAGSTGPAACSAPPAHRLATARASGRKARRREGTERKVAVMVLVPVRSWPTARRGHASRHGWC